MPLNRPVLCGAEDDARLASDITSLALADVRNELLRVYNSTITQLEITEHIDAVMRAEGSDGALSYPTVLMTRDEVTWPYGKSNDDAIHVIDPLTEPIQTVRAGARVNGQCCDVARTYLFESATQEMLDAYGAIVEAQEAVISNIASGVAVSTLDGLLQSHLSEYIIRDDVQHSHFWGHGIGEFTIMEPILSNDTEPMTLEEDQILGIQVYLLFDAGWFVRVEDTCLVTAGGVEVLSDAPKALKDMLLLSNSSVVKVDTGVESYAYFDEVSVNSTVVDSANRSILTVSYFDGISWAEMIDQGTRCFTRQYSLNTEYPSFVTGLVRVELPDTTVYSSIQLDAELSATYDEVLDPKVVVVVEGVTTEERMTWTFSKMGADMIQLHFLKVYPPPGDQFLVKDLDGNVVFEYKWNLGAEATSPWVPGCAAVVEVVPQWMSVYGGVNHFFFEVDVMGIYDPEATTTTSTTSETSSSSLTTAGSTTSSTSGTHIAQGQNPIMLAGLAAGVLVLLAFFLRRKQ